MARFRISIEMPDGATGVFRMGQDEWYVASQAHEAFVAAVGTTAPGLVVTLLADGQPIARCRVETR